VQCGDCDAGFACTYAGLCEPEQTPGGTTTDSGTDTDAQCPQDADCSGRECGADPVCGIDCGQCDAGFVCTFAGQCEVEPDTTTTTGTTDPTSSTTATTDPTGTTDPSSSGSSTGSSNTPPTADAGPDTSSFEGVRIRLDGTGTTEPDGDALTYAWLQTAGAPVVLLDADTPTPTLLDPPAGPGGQPAQYTFRLAVGDIDGSTTDTVTVTVDPWNGEPLSRSGNPFRGQFALSHDAYSPVQDAAIAAPDLVLTAGEEFLGGYGGGASIVAWDFSDGQFPVEVARASSSVAGNGTAIAVEGDFAFVGEGSGGFEVFDVAGIIAGSPTPALVSTGFNADVTGTGNLIQKILPIAGSPTVLAIHSRDELGFSGVAAVDVSDAISGCSSSCNQPFVNADTTINGRVVGGALTASGIVALIARPTFDSSDPADGGVFFFDANSVIVGTDPSFVARGSLFNGDYGNGWSAIAAYSTFFVVAVNDTTAQDPIARLRVVDVASGTPVEVPAAEVELYGEISDLDVVGDELYVTAQGGVLVYDLAGLAAGATAPLPLVRTFGTGLSGGFTAASPDSLLTFEFPVFFGQSSEWIAVTPDPGLVGRWQPPSAVAQLSALATVADRIVVSAATTGGGQASLFAARVLPGGALEAIGVPDTTGTGLLDLAIDGNVLLAAASSGDEALRSYDLAPLLAATPSTPSPLDAYSPVDAPFSNAVATLAPGLVAVGTANGTRLLDQVGGSLAELVGGAGGLSDNSEYPRDLCPSPSGDVLAAAVGPTGTVLLDVSDRTTPTTLGVLAGFGEGGEHAGCAWSRDWLFATNNAGDVLVAAASAPATEVASFRADLTPSFNSVQFERPEVIDEQLVHAWPRQGVLGVAFDPQFASGFARWGVAVFGDGGQVVRSAVDELLVMLVPSLGVEVRRPLDLRIAPSAITVPPVGTITLTATWTDGVPDAEALCRDNLEGVCTLITFDPATNTATFSYEAPDFTGDVELEVAVGSFNGFAADHLRIRVQ
jgi:hypothetical protein